MKLISQLLVAITVLLSFTVCNAQIKNSVTEKVKVFGNCGMCKTTIEKTGSLKNTAKVDWDADTQMATLTYDSKKTNQDAILKRIALSGYDSEKFLAPDDVYNNLHGCCQYERVAKVAVKEENNTMASNEDHSNHANHSEMTTTVIQNENQLKAVFDNYFLLKDALVKTDGNTASTKATALLSAINTVKMETLTTNEHTVWMKVLKNLKEDTEHIANTKDANQQRDHFDTLSINIYELIKVSKQETPIYYQFCSMANDGKGANWLSKENAVKNPYYGSMMLSCGKTVETIK
jgi:copper chaperone CopZ